LEAITTSLAITAYSTYFVALSSFQTIPIIQGITGCLGIARGVGSVIGEILIKIYGHKETFQIFGVISLVTAVLYEFVILVYLRTHSISIFLSSTLASLVKLKDTKNFFLIFSFSLRWYHQFGNSLPSHLTLRETSREKIIRTAIGCILKVKRVQTRLT